MSAERNEAEAPKGVSAMLAADRDILRWCGLMGHPFAVLCDGPDGKRRTLVECNDLATALKWAQRETNGAAYQHIGKGRWRAVREAA